VTPDAPDPWPPRFGEWPLNQQREYLSIVARRVDLLAAVRGLLDDPNGGRRLTKEELAEVVLLLDVWRSVERGGNSSQSDP